MTDKEFLDQMQGDFSHSGFVELVEDDYDRLKAIARKAVAIQAIHDEINALGGNPRNEIEAAKNETIGKCLAIIERHLEPTP